MLGLKDRLEEAAGYNSTNFSKANSIGVIGRGPSVYRLDLCYKKFNHCFLAGEFNEFFSKAEKYLSNKDIVLCIVQLGRYMTSEYNCKKFNIRNLQVKCQESKSDHKEYIKKFPDLKVVGFTKKHYDIVSMINDFCGGEGRSIFSTGIYGVISALYFNPKNIHIIGLDFYNRSVKPYYVKEKMDIAHTDRIEKSIGGLRNGMVKSIEGMADLFPDSNFYLYTTYEGIKKRRNLHIIYV